VVIGVLVDVAPEVGGVHIATPSNLPSKIRFCAGFRVLWGYFLFLLYRFFDFV
jgi:hypothetical protein